MADWNVDISEQYDTEEDIKYIERIAKDKDTIEDIVNRLSEILYNGYKSGKIHTWSDSDKESFDEFMSYNKIPKVSSFERDCSLIHIKLDYPDNDNEIDNLSYQEDLLVLLNHCEELINLGYYFEGEDYTAIFICTDYT